LIISPRRYCAGEISPIPHILPITPILPISSSGVGLPSAIPEIAPARPPPQLELDYIDIDYDTGA
jgi:hypothetical protein